MIMIWARADTEVREGSSRNVSDDKKQRRGVVHGTEERKKRVQSERSFFKVCIV